MPRPKKEKTAAEYDREIALALAQRNVHKTPALDDIDAWSVLQADRKWFRVTESKGNAKGHSGTEGQLAWLGVDGDPKALASSPYRQKVSRIGLNVPGRHGYLFLNPRHVALIHTPTSGEDRAAIEVMLHGLSNVRSGMRKRPHMSKASATATAAQPACNACRVAGLPASGTHRCDDTGCPYRHCDRCGALVGARVWRSQRGVR